MEKRLLPLPRKAYDLTYKLKKKYAFRKPRGERCLYVCLENVQEVLADPLFEKLKKFNYEIQTTIK